MVKNNSGEKTFDDNVSHNSKLSTYSKQPIHVADRFLKQVMMIGKLGGIQFQAADLSEETKTPQVEKEKTLSNKKLQENKLGLLSDSDDDTFSVNTYSMTSQS